MSSILRDLQQDHINFSKLLALLSDKMMMLEKNATPDFNLMLDILNYLEEYADLYHHPKENLIFESHLNITDTGSDIINQLIREHEDLMRLTEELCATVDGILHGDIINKEQLLEQLSEFIKNQRRHLDTEESAIFPILASNIDDKTWYQIECQLPTKLDPLFGGKVTEQYKTLCTRIV